MKRIKILFMGLAVLASVSTAIATRPAAFDCTYSTQYYFNGTTYVEVNGFGESYVCFTLPGICTYYKPNPFFQPNYYAPCRLGRFEWLD